MKEASERNLITAEEIIERISSFIMDRVDPCWGADQLRELIIFLSKTYREKVKLLCIFVQ